MNASFLFNLVMFAISAYMLYRIFMLTGRQKSNKKMLAILDQFDDEQGFFEAANQFIETEKDAEFVQKVSVLRLWGDTFYEKDEDFKKHLPDCVVEQ